ncbi:uncharacterized [Tachysurus ichikawai]
MERWRSGGALAEWWSGGVVERWRSGGALAEWWSAGRVVERWRGGGALAGWWSAGGVETKQQLLGDSRDIRSCASPRLEDEHGYSINSNAVREAASCSSSRPSCPHFSIVLELVRHAARVRG